MPRQRQQPRTPRSLLLLDDHLAFREGLRRLIEADGQFTVIAEASCGHEALRMAEEHRPALALIDIQLPGITGLQVARLLRRQHPMLRVIIVSMYLDDERLLEALHAGAAAFIVKDTDADSLLRMIAAVANGAQPIHEQLLSRPSAAWHLLSQLSDLAQHPHEDRAAHHTPLSIREMEVLDCVAQGLTNKEIAQRLFITEQTVKNHMTSMLRKLDVPDRMHAVLHAVDAGWVELAPLHP